MVVIIKPLLLILTLSGCACLTPDANRSAHECGVPVIHWTIPVSI